MRFHKKFGFRLQEDSDVRAGTTALLSFELLYEDWEHTQGVAA
jgi:hypothetical protein